MVGIQNLSLFLVSCILLNLTPGQDTIYIVGRSMAQGRKAGIVSVLGIMSGILVHTLLAALGLSVILATSSLAFSWLTDKFCMPHIHILNKYHPCFYAPQE